MQTQKLYDEYMITSRVSGFEPVEVESAQGTRIRSSSSEDEAGPDRRHPVQGALGRGHEPVTGAS